MSTFTVSGSYGTLVVDKITGLVRAYHIEGCCDEDDPENYSNIRKIDVDEYRDYYKHDFPAYGVDILDVGYWETLRNEVSVYEEPAHAWREEFRQS